MASFTFNPYASENSISKILKKKENKTKINLIDGLRDVYIKPDKQKIKEYKEYFKEFKSKNRKLYYKLRYRTYFIVYSLMIKPLKILAIKIGYKQIIKKNNWN